MLDDKTLALLGDRAAQERLTSVGGAAAVPMLRRKSGLLGGHWKPERICPVYGLRADDTEHKQRGCEG